MTSFPNRSIEQSCVGAFDQDCESFHLEENLASRIQEIDEAKKRIEAVNRRIQTDLAVAAQTQRALLPSAPPSNEAATCGWFYQPSDELGGDSLNLFSFRRNKIGMYIADVSGHGVAAALLAVTLHKTVTPVPGQPSMLTMGTPDNTIPLGHRPADLIEILNKRFPMDPEIMQYFTMCYGCLDCDNGNFKYCVAGHPQPVIVRDGVATRLPGGGLPVGFLEDADPEEYMVSLEPGDRVCIYSDGISEAVNNDNVQFGDDELMERAEESGAVLKASRPLMARTLADILETQNRMLAGEFPQLLRASGQAAEGIWIQRNVRLHPSVKLVAPVFINKNCQIDRNVQLGPNTVLSEGCIVDNGCTISDSLILPESYVGEGLEVEESIVSKDALYNVRHDVAISITDDLIMGSLADAGLASCLFRIASRLSALAILAVTWPALLVTLLIYKFSAPGTVVQSNDVVQLPRRGEKGRLNTFRTWWFGRSSVEPSEKMANRWTMWKHFFCEFLPGLTAVARGRQAFVGITPRTVEQMQQLPEEWRNLCYQSKAGVITEAFVQYGGNATQDELHTSEVFYTAVGSFRYDAALMLRYIKTLFTGPQVSRTQPVVEVRTKSKQPSASQSAEQKASV